jgi:hypothetical protein
MIKKRKKKSSATGLRIGLRKDVAELQDEFGELDLFTSLRSGDPSKSALLVVTLQRIGIRMEPDKNHKRAHVHISNGKLRRVASYAIDTGERLAGNLERKYDRLVKEWIAGRRQKLMNLWESCQAGKKVDKLVCELRAH